MLQSGLATLPVTVIMFALSRRFGALADRLGPRLFMGGGPLVAAVGIFLLARLGLHVPDPTDVLPAMIIFALGLTLTVSPLTAAVLADADEKDAGIASATNNAVARVAGLIGVAVVGVVVAGTLVGGTFAPNEASVRAFREAIVVCGVLVAAGGIVGALGIVDPRRPVAAASCSGGQLYGAPEPAVVQSAEGAGLREQASSCVFDAAVPRFGEGARGRLRMILHPRMGLNDERRARGREAPIGPIRSFAACSVSCRRSVLRPRTVVAG